MTFAFLKATSLTSPPLTADMKTLALEPSIQPLWEPYGSKSFGSDGSPLHYGNGHFTVTIHALIIDTNLDGSTATSGRVIDLLAEIAAAWNETDAILWWLIYDPVTDTYIKKTGRAGIPVWTANAQGKAVVDLEIPVRSVGIASFTYAGGEPGTVPTAPGAPGELVEGGWGWGDWGGGNWGG